MSPKQQIVKMIGRVSSWGHFGFDVDWNRVAYLNENAAKDVRRLTKLCAETSVPTQDVEWLEKTLLQIVDEVQDIDLSSQDACRIAAKRHADRFETILFGFDYEYGSQLE